MTSQSSHCSGGWAAGIDDWCSNPSSGRAKLVDMLKIASPP
jgi:hypothetical protein